MYIYYIYIYIYVKEKKKNKKDEHQGTFHYNISRWYLQPKLYIQHSNTHKDLYVVYVYVCMYVCVNHSWYPITPTPTWSSSFHLPPSSTIFHHLPPSSTIFHQRSPWYTNIHNVRQGYSVASIIFHYSFTLFQFHLVCSPLYVQNYNDIQCNL